MTFDRYEVEGELGRGAMGVVYLAVDQRIGRKVAIKTLLVSGGAGDADLRERFKREARAAGVLAHPNIVTVHDVGADAEGNPFIAMELLEGPNLAEVIRTGSLQQEQAIGILMQIADALDYAHEKGIVHRDVKPANIVLTPSGAVKITDFGIAKLESAEALTQVGHFVGTPNYIAPEQLAGQQVDGRADLFSLAVMAYELLSGKRPFTGENFTTLTYKIMNAPPPVLEQLPARAMAVLARGLAKRAEDRYPTGVELVTELARSLSLPVASRTPSGRVPERHRRAAATVAAATRAASGSDTPPARPVLPFVGAGILAALLGLAAAVALLVTTLVMDPGEAPPRTPTPTPTSTRTPRPTATRPTSKPTSRPTIRPSRPTATPSPRPTAVASVPILLNLTTWEGASGGTVTLIVDNREVKTLDFKRYVKTPVEVPSGSHSARIRVVLDGPPPRTYQAGPIPFDVTRRTDAELRVEVSEKGELTATIK